MDDPFDGTTGRFACEAVYLTTIGIQRRPGQTALRELTMEHQGGLRTAHMNAFRGVLLFALGVFALYRGWQYHIGGKAWFAYGLGLVAIALGVWRLLRNPNKPLL